MPSQDVIPPEPDGPITPDSSLVSDTVSVESAALDSETANSAQSRTTGRSIARATASIIPLHLLRFVVGFVAQPLIAHATGLRWQADAYAVATDILQRIWLLFEKVINPAFLPVFGKALAEEGEECAWRFASTAIWLTALALVVTTPLAYHFMPGIVDIYSQKADAQQRLLTVSIARLLLAGLFFLGMSSMTYVILNGYKRFAVAALGDVFWKIGIFAGAALAWKRYHVEIGPLLKAHDHLEKVIKTTSDAAQHAALTSQLNGVTAQLGDIASKSLMLVTVGFVIGAFFKLFPQLLAIGSKWRLLRPTINLKDPLVRKMLALAAPLVLGIIVSEMRGVYLQRLADDPRISVEAGRAAIKWSRTIGDNLIQIFPYALSIGIFPYLADLARRREDKQPLTDALMGALRVCFWAFIPITAVLIALSLPLLRAVWESGQLTGKDTLTLSQPFIGYSIGLLAFACEMMLNQTFYAMTRAWAPTLTGLVATVLWVIFATVGVSMGYGLFAIALAESVAKTFKCLVMWFLLRPQLGDVKWRENLAFLGKVLAGAVAAYIVAVFASKILVPAEAGKVRQLAGVGLAGLVGMAAFFAVSVVLSVKESRTLLNLATGRRKSA